MGSLVAHNIPLVNNKQTPNMAHNNIPLVNNY